MSDSLLVVRVLSWGTILGVCTKEHFSNSQTISLIFVFHSIDFQEAQVLFLSSASASVHFRTVDPSR
jgi:hypothetical protein